MIEAKTTLPEIFADLQAEWRDRRRRGSASMGRHLKAVEAQAPMLRAVIAQRRGDTAAISRLLRSKYRLTPDDQQTLAHFLDGGFEQPRKVGRPKSTERWVGMAAGQFLVEWQDVAKTFNVRTYGETGKMRSDAIEFIIAEFVGNTVSIDREAVLEFMTKRGKARRN